MKTLSIVFIWLAICLVWQFASFYRGSIKNTVTAYHPGTGGEARLTTLVAAGSQGVAHKSLYYDNTRALQENNSTAEEDDDHRETTTLTDLEKEIFAVIAIALALSFCCWIYCKVKKQRENITVHPID